MEKELIKNSDSMSMDENKSLVEDKLLLEKLYSFLDSCTKSKFLAEYKIYEKICIFREKELSGKQSFPLDSELFYEELAFALEEIFIQFSSKVQEWGELKYRLTPKYLGIKHITPEMVNYWEQRSDNVTPPSLLQRYAGLVWGFSKKIRHRNLM